ncbi:serine/threonine-protein kinase [Plantactinospora sp. ZYX-F-223]|uniref:serine/threonine-protein kinase n=1 Tax=Plantactinospora sp. ZYX-F-223 TaxID=3144103 RepID=UPI0031FCD47B
MDGGPGYVGPADAPDRYELVQRRAAGGEGEVWLARERHGADSFSYAVKLIRLDDDSAADRQLEELRLQAALLTHLEHPALVKVKEVFVGAPPHPAGHQPDAAGRRLYFVMKWIEGPSLQTALERGDVRGLDVLAPLQQVAEAIDYLHSGRDTNAAPVLHRDIKPANILLAPDGRVYLVDFGLVRLRSTDRTSRIFGTAPFMAPESLARGEYTPATDRFTLGATVYYAITGNPPLPGDPAGMVQRLTAALGPGQDRQVRGIVAMLAVQPEARPASAAAWIRALRTAPPETSVGSGVPGAAGPEGIPGSSAGSALPETSFGPAPPVSPAAAPASPGYPMPPGSIGGTRPTSPPPGYPMPPGSTGGTRPVSSPPPPPSGYPMPPSSPGGPRLSPAVGGFLSTPPPQKRGSKAPLIVVGVLLFSLVACCVGIYQASPDGDLFGTGPGATPTRSYDKSKPPPPVTALQPALVTAADITAVLKARREVIRPRDADDILQGGLSALSLCSDGRVTANAIGASETNGFDVNTGSYPNVGSAVAGFYADEANVFFDAVRTKAAGCEKWSEMQVPKLGDEALGVFADTGQYYDIAIVFVRRGQVVIEVVVEGKGGYQSDAIQLATAMAKRLPKGGA